MMNFLDIKSIETLLLTVKRMNVLDSYSKDLLMKSKKGFIWNCENGHMHVAKWLVEIGSESLPSQPALSGQGFLLVV